ncbi:Tyrosine-protein phosphatase YVH1 [Candida parapsilosis]|nr:Tyrosine-protein phosphatase YVH1 [Candida parapsilosis]KAI5906923.1 Tyrosine-protein phosphatase YVH1 [Candida parapsilosis]
MLISESLFSPKMSVERILGGIFLSSIEPINNQVDFKREYGITHILSVLPGHIDEIYTQNYQHKQIEVTDEETTNLIPYFNECDKFLDEATKNKGKVLVHCANGVSRSVAIIIVYLMKYYKLNFDQALHAVKRKCPDAGPNSAFIDQVKLYESMGFTIDEQNPKYRDYVRNLSLKQDPSGGNLRDITMRKVIADTGSTPPSYDLRCKRCRRVLAHNTDVEDHQAPTSDSRQSQFIKTAPNSRRIVSVQPASKSCSHYFFSEPVGWMREELEKSEIEGKFQCPKCCSKVGGYSWKGSRCSCGKWMVPAIHLQDAKVDSIKH